MTLKFVIKHEVLTLTSCLSVPIQKLKGWKHKKGSSIKRTVPPEYSPETRFPKLQFWQTPGMVLGREMGETPGNFNATVRDKEHCTTILASEC